MARSRLAVDIGGTFTDVAVERDGFCLTSKVLTTPGDPVRGVLDGARLALVPGRSSPRADVGAVIHGTTLATNALIERRGATVGAVVTEGFRDILEIAYERRYDQYDLHHREARHPRPEGAGRDRPGAARRGRSGSSSAAGPRQRAPRQSTTLVAARRRESSPCACCTPAPTPHTSGPSATPSRAGQPGTPRQSLERGVARRSASSTGCPRRWPTPASSR